MFGHVLHVLFEAKLDAKADLSEAAKAWPGGGTGHSTVHAAVMRVPCNAGPRHWLLPGCLRRPARWNPWAMSSRLAAPEISLRYPWDILICRPDTLPILALVTWRASDRSGVLRTKMVSSQRYQADSTWWTGDAGKRQVHHCAAHNAHNANMYSYLLLWDQTSTWQEQDLPQRQRGWILDLTLQIFWSFRMLALCFKCPQRLFFVCFLWKNAKSLVQSIESYDALALGLASWRGTFQPWAGHCDGRLFHWRRGFWAHLPSIHTKILASKSEREKRGNIGIGLAWLSDPNKWVFQGMSMNNCIEQTSHVSPIEAVAFTRIHDDLFGSNWLLKCNLYDGSWCLHSCPTVCHVAAMYDPAREGSGAVTTCSSQGAGSWSKEAWLRLQIRRRGTFHFTFLTSWVHDSKPESCRKCDHCDPVQPGVL